MTCGANSTTRQEKCCHRASEISEGLQLSKLSSVLNGLENGASAIQRHAMQAMSAVRRGTYQVDAVELSKRIVGEALRAA